MWFGNSAGKNVFWTKIRGLKKWDEEVYFEMTKNKEVVAKADYIDGYVVKLETGSYEYEGKERKTFALTLQDDESLVVLQSAFTSVGRGILNCLANAEKLGKISISVYLNKKGFPWAWIKNDWQDLMWKYDYDTQMKMTEEIKNKAGEIIQRDYTELEDWYIKTVIPEIQEKLDLGSQIDKEAEQKTEEAKKDENWFEVESEKLPFN